MGRAYKRLKHAELGSHLVKTVWGTYDPGNDQYRFLLDKMKSILDETGYDFATSNMFGKTTPIAYVSTKGYKNGDLLSFFYPKLLWISKKEALRRETSLFEPGTALFLMRPEKVIVSYYNRRGEKKYCLSEGKTAQVVMQSIEHLHCKGLRDEKPSNELLRSILKSRLNDQDIEIIKTKWGEII
jgi:peptide deformylase